MNTTTRQFVFGLIFMGIGIYRIVNGDLVDFGLYASAGAAFVANGLSAVPALSKYSRGFAILTWVLIFVAGIFFIQVVKRFF